MLHVGTGAMTRVCGQRAVFQRAVFCSTFPCLPDIKLSLLGLHKMPLSMALLLSVFENLNLLCFTEPQIKCAGGVGGEDSRTK